MSALIPEVVSLHDAALAQRIQSLLDDKTKPVGSLGQLEQLAHRIACILGSEAPVLDQPQMVVFAADHATLWQPAVEAGVPVMRLATTIPVSADPNAHAAEGRAALGAAGLAALGIEPTAAEAILPMYLDRYRLGGRYNQHAPA